MLASVAGKGSRINNTASVALLRSTANDLNEIAARIENVTGFDPLIPFMEYFSDFMYDDIDVISARLSALMQETTLLADAAI